MGELIESAALLLALIGIIIGIWYPNISKAFTEKNYFFVEKMLNRRLILLVLFSLLYTLIFLPKVIYFTNTTIDNITKNQPHIYDTVATAYCFMWLTSFLILLILVFIYIMLFRRFKKITKPTNRLSLEEWLENL